MSIRDPYRHLTVVLDAELSNDSVQHIIRELSATEGVLYVDASGLRSRSDTPSNEGNEK